MSRFLLLGHPVSHSLSPFIHAAAYRELGLSHRYEAVDCPDGAALAAFAEQLRSGDVAGANVTVPHKARALAMADVADPLARETEACNVLAFRRGQLVAYNTDVTALSQELERLAPGATCAVILGAGGAARAAASACRLRRMRRVSVFGRRFSDLGPEAPGASALAGLGARVFGWPVSGRADSAFLEALSEADVVLQATSAGMLHGPPGDGVAALVPWERVPASALAYDVVYTPAVTPFLEAARRRGLAARGGLGMLVGQAAGAIRIWLEVEPPLAAMEAAARAALGEAT
jgi:shikimate dehydrogenase